MRIESCVGLRHFFSHGIAQARVFRVNMAFGQTVLVDALVPRAALRLP